MPELAQGTENLFATEPFPGLAMWSNPMLTAWSEAGGAYLKACATWQQEVSRFMGARVEADVAAQKSLAQCRNLADAAKLQQEWAAATVNDYVNETSRLMEIASRCIQAVPVMSEVVARAGKDEPFRTRAAG